MEPTNTNSNSKKGLGIGITVLVLIIIAFVVFSQEKTTPEEAAPAPVTTSTPVDTTTQTQSSSTYKDGTYTATGSYMSPGGPDKIEVTLTIKSDIVTDASVTPEPGDSTSKKYQGIFADNYKTYVIGKDISTLNLTKVSGSSLTSKGFNDALAQIEIQAKA